MAQGDLVSDIAFPSADGSSSEAFGAPGIAPTWSAGDKDAVSTTLGTSRVWFTIGGGILNEVFWPNTGRPQLRDLGFLVTGAGFWAEVKREDSYSLHFDHEGVPITRVVHRHPRYLLTLEFVGDPQRDVVLIRYDLSVNSPRSPLAPSTAGIDDLRLHVLVAPHLGGRGTENSAWVDGDSLFATRADESLVVRNDLGFTRTSAGFVGQSDGWQDIAQHGEPQWNFTSAAQGNVALMGTLRQNSGTCALAFGTTTTGARSLARASLAEGFDDVAALCTAQWEAWRAHIDLPTVDADLQNVALMSAMVLRIHEDASYPGATVASLSTPWGSAHDDAGGYHLVWPRDCAETGLALATIGLFDDARRMLLFLLSTQEDDGHWAQNFTPDGAHYWSGMQLDETALPVILAAKLTELGVLSMHDHGPLCQMVTAAVRYLVANGPLSNQDRWEESAGANAFTMAAAIAALVGAASHGFLSAADAATALATADLWNESIEDYLYVSGTPLDVEHGTTGHYVRIAPPGEGKNGLVVVANRGGLVVRADCLVGLEFLTLVRYGLRSALDPRIVDSVRIVDAVLRHDLPGGPLYHRYQEDGYGEHEDGSPFNGSGIGRLWPLLSGERGHYAVAAGEDPMPYVRAMAASASDGGLLPEQVWDSAAIPERRLAPGRPSGSATPLVWAHAEFLKLLSATSTGVIADQLNCVAARYLV